MIQTLLFTVLLALVTPFAYAGDLGATQPSGEGSLTLLLVAPTNAQLSPQQQKVFNKIRTDLEGQSLATVPTVLSNFSQVISKKGKAKTVLADALQELKNQLAPIVQKIDRDLPSDEAMVLNLYVLPWDAKAGIQHPALQIEGVSSSMPALRVDLSQYGEPKKYYQFYNQINETILALAADPKANASRFNFYGAVAQVRLARGYSHLQLQILGSLQSGRQEFQEKSDEVDIHQIEIPKATQAADQPMVLASMSQRIDPNGLDLKPQILVEFGKWGGVSGGFGPRILGQFLMFRDEVNQNNCPVTLDHVPSLIGTTNEKALPWDLASRLLKDSSIQFRIFSLDIDPVDLKVTQMDVRMVVGPLKVLQHDTDFKVTNLPFMECFGLGGVNRKFSDKANDAIQKQLNSLYKQDDLTDDILDYVYQN